MRILAIDPASNKHEASTTGVVLLDNAKLVDSWAVSYGVKGFHEWYTDTGRGLDIDVVIMEQFEARDNDRAKDNSVLETIACIQLCYPKAILQRNAGYKSDVPDQLLKVLDLWTFKDKSHHQDLRAAARLGLFWAMRADVEEVVQDVGKRATEKMAG